MIDGIPNLPAETDFSQKDIIGCRVDFGQTMRFERNMLMIVGGVVDLSSGICREKVLLGGFTWKMMILVGFGKMMNFSRFYQSWNHLCHSIKQLIYHDSHLNSHRNLG